MAVLPYVNEEGVFSIRLESIGGLGANLAGKIIAGIAQDELHLNVSNFSSYGSEKKGSSVKSFIRFAEPDFPIKLNSPIENPHILVIFKDTLLKDKTVLAGCNANTKIILNTSKSLDEVKKYFNMPKCHLTLIDATKIAMEKKVKINGILIGTFAKVAGFISLDAILNVFKNTIGKKYPHLLESNVQAVHAGFNEAKTHEFSGNDQASYPSSLRNNGVGYKNQYIGGVIPYAGNAFRKNHEGARYGVIPFYDADKCIQCGMCNIVCSDQCIVWKEGQDKKTDKPMMNMLGIDYQYCKGCLKCVEICPVKALTQVEEASQDTSLITVDLFDKSSV